MFVSGHADDPPGRSVGWGRVRYRGGSSRSISGAGSGSSGVCVGSGHNYSRLICGGHVRSRVGSYRSIGGTRFRYHSGSSPSIAYLWSDGRCSPWNLGVASGTAVGLRGLRQVPQRLLLVGLLESQPKQHAAHARPQRRGQQIKDLKEIKKGESRRVSGAIYFATNRRGNIPHHRRYRGKVVRNLPSLTPKRVPAVKASGPVDATYRSIGDACVWSRGNSSQSIGGLRVRSRGRSSWWIRGGRVRSRGGSSRSISEACVRFRGSPFVRALTEGNRRT